MLPKKSPRLAGAKFYLGKHTHITLIQSGQCKISSNYFRKPIKKAPIQGVLEPKQRFTYKPLYPTNVIVRVFIINATKL